jgi:GNAT superfamily N-acetyltransferase
MNSSGQTIRVAIPSDLEIISTLLKDVLFLDRFSPELIEEKLFRNPAPDRMTYETLLSEAEGRLVGVMQVVGRPADRKGWIGLFGVRATDQRTGVASKLLDRAIATFRGKGIEEVEVLAIPGNYFTPGIDPRYTSGMCFLEKRGFQRFRDCVNMIGRLDETFDTSADTKRLEAAGLEIRRASASDGPLLDAYFSSEFGDDWRMEAGLALANDPPALHLALKDGAVIAFSAHSTQNREWGFFGPMGTSPETRGLGIGRLLLQLCLNDLRDVGHKTSVIPWVGPIPFYSHHAGCTVDRVFWRYRRYLT